jgi:hypothetical protein
MFLLLFPLAFADPPALLADIDAVLTSAGATRAETTGTYCDDALGPPHIQQSRQFLCKRSQPVGTWNLERLRADGGERVSARLGVRRFTSPGEGIEARQLAVELYGDRIRGLDGGLAWCYADAVWAGDLLWTLEYGCHISLGHVPSLQAVSDLVLAQGEPYLGAIGVQGLHSGWGTLMDAQHRSVEVRPPWRHFARVVGVAVGDVLWVRARPPEGGELAPKVASLAADARCVPIVGEPNDPAWWLVRSGDLEGVVASRYLARMSADDCR